MSFTVWITQRCLIFVILVAQFRDQAGAVPTGDSSIEGTNPTTNISVPRTYRSGRNQAEMLQNAIRLWNENKDDFEGREQCDYDYFDTTDQDNIDASLVWEWYGREIQLEKQKTPDLFERLGEAHFFGKKFLNNPDIECHIFLAGCTNIPRSCHTVVQHIRATQRDLPLEELFEKSRRIMIVSKKIDEYIKVHLSVEASFTPATQTSLSSEAGAIVTQYTTQPDKNSEIACNWIKAGIDISVDVIATTLSILAGNVFFKKLADETQKVCEKVVPQVITFAIRATRNLADTGDKTGDLLKSRMGGSGVDHDLHMGQSYLSGVCSLAGGGRKDENWARFTQMGVHMSSTFREIRGGLENLTNSVIHNKNATLEGSPLAMVLSSVNYHAMVDKLADGEAKFEGVMRDRFKELYMSYSYADSHCPVVCAFAESAEEQKKLCSTKWWNAKSRYCPPDADEYKNVACQAACWTSKSLDNRWHALIGETSLKADGFKVSDVVQRSWDNYLDHGVEGTSGSSLGGDFYSLNSILSNNKSGVDLPTCLSRYAKIKEYDKSLYSDGKRDLNQNFPCTCGNFRSHQTRRFMERLGNAMDQPAWKKGDNHELIETLCPWNNQWMPPFNHFAAFCELDIRHALHSDKDASIEMTRGSNKYCDGILLETANMTEREANRHFCHSSYLAQQVFKEERDKSSALIGYHSKSHSISYRDWSGTLWGSNDTILPRKWEDHFKKLKPPPGFIIPVWNETQYCQDFMRNATYPPPATWANSTEIANITTSCQKTLMPSKNKKAAPKQAAVDTKAKDHEEHKDALGEHEDAFGEHIDPWVSGGSG